MKSLKEKLVQEGLIKRQAGMDIKNKIEAWLKEYDIKNYTINDDLTIDVNGNVNLYVYEGKQLPNYIQFGKITQGFNCIGCSKLESLVGCPKEAGGNFYCSHCPELKSLEGAPKEVEGSFWCNDCPKLESLEGAPQKVGGNFYCSGCGAWFAKEDVKKVCKVRGNINV